MRKELAKYLSRGSAHMPLEEAARNFPKGLINSKLKGIPYAPWGLLEHIRLAQHDMLEFIRNPDYEEMNWPDDYWPDPKHKATPSQWAAAIKNYKNDLAALIALAKNGENDLFAPISGGEGQTIAKEILQTIDHASYHTGELIIMMQALKAKTR